MNVGILGGSGFVGKNVIDYFNCINLSYCVGSRAFGVDARVWYKIVEWIEKNNITHVVNLAATCGGIGLNKKRPFDLWLSTTQISAAVLKACTVCEKPVVMVGTVCSYAENNPVPFRETDLMKHGEPEPTNRAYGVTKLNSLYGAQAAYQQYGINVANLIPVNMYGPYDHFDLENSHVIPAIIRKIVDAMVEDTDITLWGDGSVSREFLFAGDLASAIVKALTAMDNIKPFTPQFINIGTGKEITIKNLAKLIANLMNFNGKIHWDDSKPNGQPRRCLDISRASEVLDWRPKVSLEDGLMRTIDWYRNAGHRSGN